MKYYSYLVAAVVASLILGISSLFLSVHTAVTLEQMSRQISSLKSPISGELTPSSKPPASPELSTTPAETEISTWNTYDDKPIGIHFKYPKSWDLKGPKSPTYPILDLSLGNPTCGDCDQPPAMTVKVWSSVYKFDTNTKNLNAKNLPDLLAKYSALPDPLYQNVKTLTVGGKPAYQADAGPNVFGGGQFVFVPLTSGKLIELWFFQSASAVMILPTFAF